MSNTAKSRKPLIVGIVAAVVVLVVLLVLLLTQCTGMFGGGTANPNQESTTGTVSQEAASYDLYWNLDRKLYDGMSEAGLSSRQPAEDGYFHVRFFKDGETVELKVADRKTVNALEVKDLMGLEFDENGIVVGVIDIDDMPLQKAAWQFYIQSSGGNIIKVNSSQSLNGMEVMLEKCDKTLGVWDMTGKSGEPGCETEPFALDRVYAIQNEDGELTHVFIYDRSEYMSTHEAECKHCGKVVTWYEWVKEDKLPLTAGHYQLQNNITLSNQMSMEEDAKICLDLNGKQVDGCENRRMYSLHNVGTELAMMDTSEEKNGKFVAHGTGDQGMCVWLRYGAFYLYEGILDASKAATIKCGTTVYVSAKTYFYMYGGELIGGTSKYVKNETTGKYSQGLGGTIYIGGKMVMNDGIVRDGYAQAVTYKKDGNKVWERGIGGNIFMANNSVLEMNGGVIKNGKAGNMAGNIYMDGASEFTMNGGKIQGGTISGKGKNGGSLYVTSKAKVTMNGGSISGGTCRNCGGNVYLNGVFTMNGGTISGGKIRNYETGKLNPTANHRNMFIVNGQLYMYGGRIYGGVSAIDSKAGDKKRPVVLLSGYATIKGTVEGGTDLYLSASADKVKVRVGNMLKGSTVGVYATTGIFSEKTKESNVDNFYSNVPGAEVFYHEGRLALGKQACLCGANEGEEHIGECDGKMLVWGPWTSASELPKTGGNYYLTKDVTCGQQSIAADSEVVLDLNGFTVTGKNNARIYSLHYQHLELDKSTCICKTDSTDKAKHSAECQKVVKITGTNTSNLTITDSSQGHVGKMIAKGSLDTQGAIVWLRYGNFNLYRGTLDASGFVSSNGWSAGKDGVYGTADDEDVNKRGVAVDVPNGREFHMYDGTIIGGSTIKRTFTKTVDGVEVTYTNKNLSGAGAVNVEGNFYMHDGVIRDGAARQGGNVFVSSKGKFYMSGGEILNGRTYDIGGNIYANGWIYLSGGKISGGYYQKTDADEKNYDVNHANMTFVNGKMEMTGGEIDGRVNFLNYNSVSGCTVNFGGSPVIHGADIGAIGLSLSRLDDKADDGVTAEAPLMNIDGELEDSALVYLGSNCTGFVSGETVEANADNFKSDLEGMEVLFHENRLFIGVVNCVCGEHEEGVHINGCNGTEYVWEAWSAKGTLPTTTGNYILTGDVTTTGQSNVTAGNDVKLDINGHNVTYKVPKNFKDGFRLYRAENGAKLAITDTTAGTPGTLTTVIDPANSNYVAEQTAGNGAMLLWARGGEITVHNGIFDGSALSGAKDGLTVFVGNNAGYVGKLVMHGGTIKCGNNTANGNITVSGAGAEFIMNGGTITGGRAKNGGNIYIRSGSVTINDGTVEKGSTKAGGAHGGNIFVHNDATLTITGGEILDGQTGNLGGNIKADGDIIMTGGTIKGGMNKNGVSNANANVDLVNGSLDISGGQIWGSVEVNSYNSVKGATLTVSGSAKITGGTSGVNLAALDDMADDGVTATRSDIIVKGTLNDDALIEVIGSVVGFVTGDTVEANADNFVSNNSDYEVAYIDGRIFIGKIGCLCGSNSENAADHALGCDGVKRAWTPWTKGDSLPITSGNWYLTKTVNCAQQSIAANQAVVLDLNGQTVNGTGNRIYSVHNAGASLLITDTTEAKNGKLVSKELNSTNQGGCVWVRYGSFTLLAGTLDARKTTVKAAADGNRSGGAVCMGSGTTFDMYGGTIYGGNCTVSDNGQYNSIGGAVYVSGTFTMYDGTISGGKAVYGGNVYVPGGSTFIMKNGTITGGETNKTGCHGGNVYVAGNGTMTFENGLIEKGKAHNLGGNIYINGTLNMSGGEVKGGTNISGTATRQSNLAMINGTLNMSGGQIYGHVDANSYNSVKGCKVNLSGSAKITGGTSGLYLTALDDEADDGITATRGEINITGTLADTAKIDIHKNVAGYITGDTVEANVDNFSSENALYTVGYHDGKVYIGKVSCLCGSNSANTADHALGCDGVQYAWTPWTETTTLPTTSGYWFLTGGVKCGQQSIAADQAVVLDLNGQTVDGTGNRIYSVHNTGASLVITDTTEEKAGKLVAKEATTASQGGCVWVRYGSFKLIAGTLDASKHTVKGAATYGIHGAAVCVDANTTFDMYGGTILGGTAVTSDNGSYSGHGGAVCVSGTFTMHDGTITGGTAINGGSIYVGSTGSMTMKKGTISGGKANNGGSIYLAGGSTMTMKNGTISGGETNKSSCHGGNFYVADTATLTIEGGLIENGKAHNLGGNIKSDGTVIMKGGEIKGGTNISGEAKANSNLCLINGELDMSGGQIYGHVEVNSYNTVKGSVIKVSGSAKITGGTTGVYFHELDDKADDGITATAAPIVVTGTLNDDAIIEVHSNCYGYITEATVEANLDNFVSNTGLGLSFVDNCVFLGRKGCLCGSTTDEHAPGCNGDQLIWKPWNSGNTLPTATGNYYLTQNVTCPHQQVAKNAAVVIDLNGKTVNGSNNQRIISTFNTGSSLVITDTVGGGTMLSHGTTGDQGSVVWVRYGSFKLIKGTLDASDFTSTTKISGNGTADEKAAYKSGTAVGIEGVASFTMYGGTIIGGKQAPSVKSTNGVTYGAGAGGSVAVLGTFTMEGGTIKSGSTEADGGNLFVSGTFKMKGGTIEDGKAVNGGNISVNGANAVIDITGGTIQNGEASVSGGNFFVYGSGAKSFTVEGSALITGGKTTGAADSNGGNFYCTPDSATTINIFGGTVSDGVAGDTGTAVKGSGGNFWLHKNTKLIITSGGTVSGGEGVYGGNIAVNQATNSLEIGPNGTIQNGVAWKLGGNIWQNSTANSVLLDGGTISGGQNGADGSKQNGGSIYISKNATFELKSGTIKGGTTTNGGGNIYNNGILKVSGGKITGGKKSDGTTADTLNVFVVNGTLELTGGQIDGYAAVVNSTAANNSVLKISGNPVVKNADGTNGLKLQKLEGATMWPVAQITGTIYADILVNFAAGSAVTGNTAKFAVAGTGVELTDALKDNFTSQQGYKIARYADGLYFVPADAHIHCVCGGTIASGTVLYKDAEGNDVVHTCVDTLFTPASAALSTTGSTKLTADKSLYLDSSITLKGQVWTQGYNLDLCLNGNTLTGANNNRVLGTYSGGTIDITTCDANYADGSSTKNAIIAQCANNATSTANGGVVWAPSSGVVNLYRGTLDAAKFVLVPAENDADRTGAAVHLDSGIFIQHKNTTIIGGFAGGTSAKKSHGGTVSITNAKSKYYMLGGTIKNGKAYQLGGNVWISAGEFNMLDGTIKDGGITTTGASPNKFTANANVTLHNTGVLNMTGGTIVGSVNSAEGKGTLNISGTARIARNDTSLIGNNIWANFTVNVGNLEAGAGVGFIKTSAYTGEVVLGNYVGDQELDLSKIGIYMFAHREDTTRTFGVKLVDGKIIAYETTPTT